MSPYKDQDNLCFCSLPDLRVSLSYQSLKKSNSHEFINNLGYKYNYYI